MEDRFQVDGYKILERLGQGGMGLVFKAVKNDTLYAIKFLSPNLSTEQEYIESFVHEASIAIKLDHPNIVKGIEYDSKESHFFVMEFVAGCSVREILRQQKMEVDRVCQIILEISKALEYVQEFQLVHRDVKPANIIVSTEHQVKLCDLGLAKPYALCTREHLPKKVHGTVHYMSPEQVCNQEMNIRSDIYSLGITFYHMLAGSVPYKGSKRKIMEQHVKNDLPDLRETNEDIPCSVVEIIQRMTAKKIEDRYFPKELIQDLAKVTGDQLHSALPQQERELAPVETKQKISPPLDENLLTVRISSSDLNKQSLKKAAESDQLPRSSELSIICLECQTANNFSSGYCSLCHHSLTYNDQGLIKVRCSCGKRISISQKFAGEQGNCPNCQKSIPIPEDYTWLIASSNNQVKKIALMTVFIVITFGALIFSLAQKSNAVAPEVRSSATIDTEKRKQRIELEKINDKYAYYRDDQLEAVKHAYVLFNKKYPRGYYQKDVQATIANIQKKIERIVYADYRSQVLLIKKLLAREQFQNALIICRKLEKSLKYRVIRGEILKLRNKIIEQNNKSLRLTMATIDQQISKESYKQAYELLANSDRLYLEKDTIAIENKRELIREKNRESLENLTKEIESHIQKENFYYALLLVKNAESQYLANSLFRIREEKQKISKLMVVSRKQKIEEVKQARIPYYSIIEWHIHLYKTHFDASDILAILELKQKNNSLKDVKRAYTNILRFAKEDNDPTIQRAQTNIKSWLSEYVNSDTQPQKIAMNKITLKNGRTIVVSILETEDDYYRVQEEMGDGSVTFNLKKSRIKSLKEIWQVSREEQNARLDFEQLLKEIGSREYNKARKTLRKIMLNDGAIIKKDIRFQMDAIWDTNPKLLCIYPPSFIESLHTTFQELKLCSDCRGESKQHCSSCGNIGFDLTDGATKNFVEARN